MLADHRLEQDRTPKAQAERPRLFTRPIGHAAAVTDAYGPHFRPYFGEGNPQGGQPRQDPG